MRRTMYVLAVIGGLLAMVGGLALGVGLGILASTGARGYGTSPLQQNTLALAVGFIGVFCGALLAWAGARGISQDAALRQAQGAALRQAQGPGSEIDMPFRLPGWGWWLLALLIVLLAGNFAFNAPAAFGPFLPIFHLLAGTLSALLFLSLAVSAARSRGRNVSARAATASLAWGALGGAGIAIAIELVLFLLAILLAALWLSATEPGAIEQLQSWAIGQLQNPGQNPDLGFIADLARSPVVILGVLLLIGVAVPIVEETTKSLAIPLVYLARRDARREVPRPAVSATGVSLTQAASWATQPLSALAPNDPNIGDQDAVSPVDEPGPAAEGEGSEEDTGGSADVQAGTSAPALTRLDGFLIGVAAGAGFTLLEGILNGSLALSSPESWAQVMLLRAGTAALHCLATGLGGLGWQAILVEHRRRRGVGLWLAAAGLHGIWNASAGLTTILALAGQSGGGSTQMATTALVLLVTAFMAVTWLAVVAALPIIARRLARQ